MEQSIKNKILLFGELVEKVKSLQQSGSVVVQSHGTFDLVHPGVIRHLNSAKSQGDILIVTIIQDKDVRRGPGRPVFPEELRAENVASLSQVDFVCIVNDQIPFGCVKKIKPDVFAKGQSYKKRDTKIHGKIFEDEKELYFEESRLHETEGYSFSSSQIINNFLDIYPKGTKEFLRDFSKNYSFRDIVEGLNNLKDMKVLLIGDGIIDEYHYCTGMSKTAKAHLVSTKHVADEAFTGGAFAIANHIAGLCDNLHLVTLLGSEDSREEFIHGNMSPNIKTSFFYREDGPTIAKRRYIEQYFNQKLFEINYLNDEYIDGECEKSIIKYLKEIIPDYDVVLVSDFGHGFITKDIINVIEKYSKKYAVNTQTNSANAGFNLITKYKNPYYVCLDEPEMRYTAQDKFADIDDITLRIKDQIEAEYIIVTLGRSGSIGINSHNEINHTPIFSSKVIDTVGAGDAFFAFTAPCFAQGMPVDLVSFIGNAVGAIAVQIVCNKRPVEKHELLEFIHTLLK